MSLPPIKCPYCEAEMPVSMYAAAHYDELLTATCQSTMCGKQFITRRGRTLKTVQPKRKK